MRKKGSNPPPPNGNLKPTPPPSPPMRENKMSIDHEKIHEIMGENCPVCKVSGKEPDPQKIEIEMLEAQAHLFQLRAEIKKASTSELDSKYGLTDEEQKVMYLLVAAWNEYMELPIQNKEDIEDFRKNLHRLQDLLALRIVRRDYPDGWK